MKRILQNKKEKLEEYAKENRKSMTPAENILWSYFRNHRFHNIKFRRQVQIDEFIVDFYAASIKLVVECDGIGHKSNKEYDLLRDTVLENKYKLNILRFENDRITGNEQKVLDEIWDFICNLSSAPLL